MKLYTHKKTANNKGFTLIELIAAIAIIGILSAIAVNRYSSAVFDARSAKVASTLEIVEKAKDMYVVLETTTTNELDTYNTGTDAVKLGRLYPLMRINGTQPTNTAQLTLGTGMLTLLPGKIAVPAHVVGGTQIAAVAGTPATLNP